MNWLIVLALIVALMVGNAEYLGDLWAVFWGAQAAALVSSKFIELCEYYCGTPERLEP